LVELADFLLPMDEMRGARLKTRDTQADAAVDRFNSFGLCGLRW
jgi:hypothetical protein